MKANEAPKKIYLQVCGDCNDNDCVNCKFEDVEDNVTWCKDKIFEEDIEYTRTDAFIEKACKFLKDRIEHDSIDYPMATKHLIEDFKKYMKR